MAHDAAERRRAAFPTPVGMKLARRIPEIIANGHGGIDGSGRYPIDHGGARVVLTRGGKGAASPWVLTAYDVKK